MDYPSNTLNNSLSGAATYLQKSAISFIRTTPKPCNRVFCPILPIWVHLNFVVSKFNIESVSPSPSINPPKIEGYTWQCNAKVIVVYYFSVQGDLVWNVVKLNFMLPADTILLLTVIETTLSPQRGWGRGPVLVQDDPPSISNSVEEMSGKPPTTRYAWWEK